MISLAVNAFVELWILAFPALRIAPLRNHRNQPVPPAKVDNPLAVTALVAHDPLEPMTPFHGLGISRERAEQGAESGGIMDVPRGQGEQERVALGVADQVDLGGESSPGAPQRLFCRAVFRVGFRVARFF